MLCHINMLRPYPTCDEQFDDDFVLIAMAIQNFTDLEDLADINDHKSNNISPQSILLNDCNDLNDLDDTKQEQTTNIPVYSNSLQSGWFINNRT